MNKIVYINGKFTNYKNAKISIEDRGFQFADSIYEVVGIYNKKLLDLEFHINRLKYSLNELNIKFTFNTKLLVNIFEKLIKINLVKNGIIYLQITRGVQSRSHVFNKGLKPTLVIYTQHKSFNLPNKYFKGVKVITHEDLRWIRRDIKTTNLLPNILAEQAAHNKNAYTAILVKDNKITEGSHSNIWIVKNKIIYTHPANNDILKGVTRTSLLLVIKKLNYKFKEKKFTKRQLINADEVFLTSSSSFITPIIKIDSIFINNSKIGIMTRQLAKSYFKFITNE